MFVKPESSNFILLKTNCNEIKKATLQNFPGNSNPQKRNSHKRIADDTAAAGF